MGVRNTVIWDIFTWWRTISHRTAVRHDFLCRTGKSTTTTRKVSQWNVSLFVVTFQLLRAGSITQVRLPASASWPGAGRRIRMIDLHSQRYGTLFCETILLTSRLIKIRGELTILLNIDDESYGYLSLDSRQLRNMINRQVITKFLNNCATNGARVRPFHSKTASKTQCLPLISPNSFPISKLGNFLIIQDKRRMPTLLPPPLHPKCLVRTSYLL